MFPMETTKKFVENAIGICSVFCQDIQSVPKRRATLNKLHISATSFIVIRLRLVIWFCHDLLVGPGLKTVAFSCGRLHATL